MMREKVSAFKFLWMVLTITIPSIAWSQQEAVNGYYDSANDWIVFEWINPNSGKQQGIYDSSNKIKPVIHVSTVYDQSSGNFTYVYSVTNLSGAMQAIDDILVKHYAPVYQPTSPSPEAEWLSTEYKGKSTWSWSRTKGPVKGIPAGQTVSGFSFKSKGLPTILGAAFTGKRRAELRSPSPDDDTQEVQDSYDRVFTKLQAQYPNKFVDGVQQKTVGPIDPPATFAALDFITSLISLKEQARTLGWIDKDGTTTSLDAKLNDVQKKIASGDTKSAKNVLNAFLNEVQAQNGKHITSEAYALLYFNAKYLFEHL